MTSASSLDPYDLISKLKLGFKKLFEHPQTTKSFCILSLNIVETSLIERHRYILRFKVTGIILTQFGYVLRFIYEILNIRNILSFKSHWIVIILRRENYYET